MALSAYEGRPASDDSNAVVTRAAAHYRWSTEEPRTEHCTQCGDSIDTRTRHVRLTLSRDRGDTTEFRYFCTESCVSDWMSTP